MLALVQVLLYGYSYLVRTGVYCHVPGTWYAKEHSNLLLVPSVEIGSQISLLAGVTLQQYDY